MKNTSFFIILNFIKKIKIDTTICVSLKKKLKNNNFLTTTMGILNQFHLSIDN